MVRGWGKTAHLLVGSLAHSGKWRAALSPSMDQPHLVQSLDRVVRALGGVSRALADLGEPAVLAVAHGHREVPADED